MVKDNIDESSSDSWYELIGTPGQGINYDAKNELCLMDPLPEAINVLRQHMITTVVVSSFFNSIFASDPSRRKAARSYLSKVLPREVPEVTYQISRR
jgi:hypothetical protein